VLKIDGLLEKEILFFSIIKIYITVVTIVHVSKLLTKVYSIVYNVGLLRVSLTFSIINIK